MQDFSANTRQLQQWLGYSIWTKRESVRAKLDAIAHAKVPSVVAQKASDGSDAQILQRERHTNAVSFSHQLNKAKAQQVVASVEPAHTVGDLLEPVVIILENQQIRFTKTLTEWEIGEQVVWWLPPLVLADKGYSLFLYPEEMILFQSLVRYLCPDWLVLLNRLNDALLLAPQHLLPDVERLPTATTQLARIVCGTEPTRVQQRVGAWQGRSYALLHPLALYLKPLSKAQAWQQLIHIRKELGL